MTKEEIIYEVKNLVTNGKPYNEIGGNKLLFNNKVFHWRWKGISSPPYRFPFGINNNSLDSDYEIWICASTDAFYVIPTNKIIEMYNHPNAYVDRMYPNIRALTAYTHTDKATYARPGIQMDIKPYRNKPFFIEEITPIILPTQEEISLKKYGSFGEGKEHLELKNLIANNPDIIGIKNVIKVENDNHVFPSNDRPDIIFTCSDEKYYVIEIEIENCFPGAYQAIKYKSLFCAEKRIALNADNIIPMLIARKINTDVKQFCTKYGVQIIEIHK